MTRKTNYIDDSKLNTIIVEIEKLHDIVSVTRTSDFIESDGCDEATYLIIYKLK